MATAARTAETNLVLIKMAQIVHLMLLVGSAFPSSEMQRPILREVRPC